MGTYIARRLLLMIPTLVGITFLVFMLVALSPGGIGASLRMAGGQMEATSRALHEAYLEDRYGLDDPAVVQYVRWLGRISPIKFGPRDQIAPTGERVVRPKALRTPPLWDWFTDDFTTATRTEPWVWEPGTTDEEKARTYRRQSNAYAQARAGYITARANFEQEFGGYARRAGSPEVIRSDGKIDDRAARRTEIDKTTPGWDRVEERAAKMIAAYHAAHDERENTLALFRARPLPQDGVGIIPGVFSLAWPDLGVSFSRSRPVGVLIAEALPVTLLLNLIAFPIIYLIAIPSGMLAAVRQGTWIDIGLGAFFIALWSFPIVLAGVLAIGYLASNQYLGAFPVSGLHSSASEDFTFLPTRIADGSWQRGFLVDTLWHICLPVACLVYGGFAVLSKQARAAMLDNFNADYVRTAKAKGVAEKDIVLRHVFRNSLIPLITMFVTIFPAMLSGSVVIETIFTVPGMGRLAIQAIELRDRELILATTLMIAAVNLFALLLADILYALADPRISYE